MEKIPSSDPVVESVGLKRSEKIKQACGDICQLLGESVFDRADDAVREQLQ